MAGGILPSDPMAAVNASMVSQAVALSLSQTLLTSSFNAGTRWLDYGSNILSRNLIPPLETLMQLYYAKLITFTQLQQLAAMHGADFTGGILAKTNISAAWEKLLQQKLPTYDLGFLRQLKWRNVAGADVELRSALQKSGFPNHRHPEWYADWLNISPVDTIVQLFLQETVNSDDAKALIRQHGFSDLDASRILDAADKYVSSGDALTMYRYGLIDRDQTRKYLNALGLTDPALKDEVEKLRFTPPSVSGLYQSATANVWNDVFAAKWGLDDDRPRQLGEWEKRLGLDFSAGTDPYGTQPVAGQTNAPGSFTWAKALWRGHWSLPSTSFLAQIIHRFRGDPQNPSTWNEPGYPPLSQDEIWEMLKANGMPTLARNYWGRLVYEPINLRLTRVMVQFGGWGLPEVVNHLQDNGLSPRDASQLGPALLESLQPKAKSGSLHKLTASVAKAYGAGVLTHGDALASLVNSGVTPQDATIALTVEDIDQNTRLMEQVIATTRGEVLSGRITMQDGQSRLAQAGMDPARVVKIVHAWTLQFTEKRRQLETGRVQSLLRKGLLTKNQALVRLHNLGWNQPDEVLLMAEVQQQVHKDQAAAVKAMEAKVSGQERQIISTLGRMGSTVSKLVGRLKTITPVASILDWYKQGLWTEKQVRDRLRLLGYPDSSIDDMILHKLGLPAGSAMPETVAPKGKP